MCSNALGADTKLGKLLQIFFFYFLKENIWYLQQNSYLFFKFLKPIIKWKFISLPHKLRKYITDIHWEFLLILLLTTIIFIPCFPNSFMISSLSMINILFIITYWTYCILLFQLTIKYLRFSNINMWKVAFVPC